VPFRQRAFSRQTVAQAKTKTLPSPLICEICVICGLTSPSGFSERKERPNWYVWPFRIVPDARIVSRRRFSSPHLRGESLFIRQPTLSFIKRSMFIEPSSGSTSLSNSR
jgi:hypothetical protein